MAKSPISRQSKAELNHDVEALKLRLAQMEANLHHWERSVEAMRESEQKYRILLDDSSDPIFSFNHEGQYQYVNLAFADGVGKKIEDILHKKIWDVFPQDEADKRYAAVKWVFTNQVTKVIEVRVPRADGDRYYITTVKPVFSDLGEVTSVICISKEITERKRIEEELIHLSNHDTLTGLYNRNFYEVELGRLQCSRLYPITIVVADMDNLKSVNDRYGHPAGDALIQKVSHYMLSAFRTEDIVARIGGDEFAVLLPMTDATAAEGLIHRLREQLAVDNDPRLHVSIGVASGGEGSNLQEVMREADDRMYREKFAKRKS
jgi:diguanylate cyclase (GGDEF)-like protein/PAS domain S-box-containing protein